MAPSLLYTQSSTWHGEGEGLLRQHIDNFAGQDVAMPEGGHNGAATQIIAGPSSVLCYGCGQSFSNVKAVLRHLHTAHHMPLSPHCSCAMCRFSRNTPPPEQGLLGGQGGAAASNAVLQGTAPLSVLTSKQATNDADIWSKISETNLPPLLGQLEAGTLLTSRDGSIVYRTRAAAPPPLLDTNGNQVRSAATSRLMRDISFLPTLIPADIPIWHIHFFERLAASKGVDLLLTDIMDRLPPHNTVSKNGLDMKLQRYRASMGYLPLVNKDLERSLAFQSNVSTIQDLMVWQGKSNTIWLPTHMGRKGPWKVVQPNWHPGHKNRVAGGSRGGGIYIIDSLPGLSDRVRNIADTIVYLDCKLIDLRLTPAAELDEEDLALKQEVLSWYETLEPCSGARALMLKRTSNAEFEHWLARSRSGVSLKQIRRALEVAEAGGGPCGEEYVRVVGGDEKLVVMLSGS
ncbi:hypothetical protein LTR78_006551 [Recurvomyces mirabilis]|uniref:C2H2-type domain-containing protein n=1 Tax=Recurvomyces mirabilis TaxID=574656 RepID=A0AAE0WL02_9PEZI|nr:hypothetical protein LTR78_006551 [Recurvomyces mirabilis]KAK5151031.1 hypothetical protein LTS14_009526 [Recurvomyces mirabilis]